MLLKLLVLTLYAISIFSQSLPGCRNHAGETVDWFLIYYAPRKIRQDHGYGYLYMDSTFTKSQFDYYQGTGDQKKGPLDRTISQSTTESIAWNDQPDIGKGDSNKAHSKFFMAYDKKYNGYAIAHSVPKYPSISESGKFKVTINSEQKQNAQHLFCMTVRDQATVDNLKENGCFISPNIYHPSSQRDSCKKYSQKENTFEIVDYQIGHTQMKAIYKNGKRTYADIFSQGLTGLVVQSSIVIQTWQTPQSIYCQDNYHVLNSERIYLTEEVWWKQTSDHSKYAYAIDNDYVCFGDLNRNTEAQKRRGGAFYCFESPHLNKALKNINPREDTKDC